MLSVPSLLVCIPLLPLVGAIFCAVFGGVKELRRWAHLPAALCAALSFVCVAFVVAKLTEDGAPIEFPVQDSTSGQDVDIQWFSVGHGQTTVSVPFELSADAIAGIMLLGITFIGFWIVVFSIGYMHGSPGFARYFSVVSLFLASMTLMVLANNFILMFAGWEGVGLCSYLLVGYWHHKPSAADAARKAFLVTRLGDVGLILGIFLMWALADQHSFNYAWIFNHTRVKFEYYSEVYTAACLLILCGAVGKSAQIPLYVWLPDAMEGPTPVSALIHAATMVTAGVYLLARCAPLFVLVPGVQVTIAIIGAATALLAAFIALTQHDLKRVLAYSTVSQIGFMFLAVGCGGAAAPVMAVTAGLFHLFTHAFFKAVLFLSAGSVMHGMHDVIDMRQFSGLKRVMPITRWTFLAGALALAGVPVFAGFWSKDMILETVLEAGHSDRFGSIYMVLFGVAAVTALMTAFYTFRAYFRTFEGELKMPEGAHPHEPWVMSVPLIVLALGAVGIGFVHATPLTHWFGNFISKAPELMQANGGRHVEDHANWGLMFGSAAIALLGVGAAYYMYRVKPGAAEKAASAAGNVYYLSLNKVYVDEIYNLLFVQPLNLLAGICKLFEAVVYDLVRLIASIPRYMAEVIRPLQNGLVQFYALTMAIGVAVFVGMLLFFHW
ncbi:MAG TPA: NADH-quinone oxidoreductase subunit L [Gemmataceae bacterium]|jgi:NADH-quinone oxidoreductase subunit L|nr:NADH-quinone oxidoreductase subunit L [Gemmataceae bacterium]